MQPRTVVGLLGLPLFTWRASNWEEVEGEFLGFGGFRIWGLRLGVLGFRVGVLGFRDYKGRDFRV